MANERITINGGKYISMDYLIEHLVETCLQYHLDGDLGAGDFENFATIFVDTLLKFKLDDREAYDAFVRSYVHQRYPQVFGKEKEP